MMNGRYQPPAGSQPAANPLQRTPTSMTEASISYDMLPEHDDWLDHLRARLPYYFGSSCEKGNRGYLADPSLGPLTDERKSINFWVRGNMHYTMGQFFDHNKMAERLLSHARRWEHAIGTGQRTSILHLSCRAWQDSLQLREVWEHSAHLHVQKIVRHLD